MCFGRDVVSTTSLATNMFWAEAGFRHISIVSCNGDVVENLICFSAHCACDYVFVLVCLQLCRLVPLFCLMWSCVMCVCVHLCLCVCLWAYNFFCVLSVFFVSVCYVDESSICLYVLAYVRVV